jgi:thiamine-phosphate pyrophosphorylase
MDAGFPPLYVILDAIWLKTPPVEVLLEMAESGVTLVQYRDKQASPRRLFEISSELARTGASLGDSEKTGLRLILNDRPDIAWLSGAAGVHVGQQDLAAEDARAIMGPSRWVGISTHTLEQVDAADRTSADYVAFGPIFWTATKERPDPLVGLPGLAAARQRTRKPLVAIGGITIERAAEVFAAGADSLAVARDILAANHRGDSARAYLETAARMGLPKQRQSPNNSR